jgi:hypothetical protein
MILCVNEGKLRACMDRELPEDEARSISHHLLGCRPCRIRFEQLRSSAAAVATAIDSLPSISAEAVQDNDAVLARILSVPGRKFAPSRLQVSLACVGLILLVFIMAITEKRTVVPAVSDASRSAMLGNHEPPGADVSGLESDGSAGTALGDVDGYLPLDDGEPIQIGFVVRMNLPASVLTPWESGMRSEEIKADVIVDESGRARAVRFLR